MKKRRILLLLHELSLTGAPKVALDAFEAMHGEVDLQVLSLGKGPLSERCHTLGCLTILPETIKNVLTMNPAIFSSVAVRGLLGLAKGAARLFVSRLERQIRSWKPDMIYVNSVGSLRMLKILNLPKVPILLHVHELDVGLRLSAHGYEDVLLEAPSRYIAVSEAVQELLIKHYKINPERISLIHEFVPDELCNVNASGGDGALKDAFIVGGAGQHNWRKGTFLWLQMARDLTHLMGKDKVRFVWVGVPDNYEGWIFRETARKLGIEDSVEFVPVTPQPLPHYNNFDVFAMTSMEDPCPIVVLENMMLQKPVVCFAGGGGAPEEVGEAGIVITDFSPSLMAAAIAELAEHPDRMAMMGKLARERVHERFTASVQVPKITAEINRLIVMSNT